ncbi:uncharacterized protein LOC127718435 [Mytilus californianus]|uniref:uncharacterized protein LOC127718435 n=1 Tax=Mytilus californianus TaxID=6549 RepID=UPI0022460322|nr:uncharacterized protein LOC127718435 [Mytilus californianus]
MEKDMSKIFCSSHEHRLGIIWCMECEKILCTKCRQRHDKTMTEHPSMGLSEYVQFPKFALSMNNLCEIHGQQLEMYCQDHNMACCMKCYRNGHELCKGISFLHTFVKEFKQTTLFTDLMHKVQALSHILENLIKNTNENRESLYSKKSSILLEIANVRRSLNEHFDNLEKDIVEDLDYKYNEARRNTNEQLSLLDDKNTDLKRIDMDLTFVNQYATDLQAFLGVRILSKQVEDDQMDLQTLQKDNKLCKVDLELTMEPKFLSILKEIKSLGTISIQSTPNISIIPTEKKSRTITHLKLKRRKYIKIKSEHNMVITGCAILPGLQTVFADFQNSLLVIHNIDGTHNRNIKLCGRPSDMAVVADYTIVVTLWSLNVFVVLDLREDKEIRKVQMKENCYSIDFCNEKILVSFENSKIVQIMDIFGNISRKIQIPSPNFSYVVQHENMMLCSNRNENKVICCTEFGKLSWAFQHELLSEPHQIAIDNNRFLYVTCHGSDKVMAICSDGQSSKILLDSDDGINKPSALHIQKDILLVCNSLSGDAHLYDIICDQ